MSRQEYMIRFYASHPNYRETWREANHDKVLAHRHTYYKVHPEAILEETKKARANHPEKFKCRERARYYSLDLKCNSCGAISDLQRHHPDYTKPEIFVTLCRKCHGKLSRRKP
jgi:hypothetical protein